MPVTIGEFEVVNDAPAGTSAQAAPPPAAPALDLPTLQQLADALAEQQLRVWPH